MIRRLIREFPKLFVVSGVIIVSSILFGVWWLNRAPQRAIAPRAAEDIRPKIAVIESAPKRLLLVDNDLYDLDSGALIFKDWLKGGTPLALFYDSKEKKVIARHERGFVRYSLDGKEEATLLQKSPPAFSDDLSWVVYAKEKDLWRADVDWAAWKFVNERRLTNIEQFNEQFFAANILLGTDKVLVVRNNNQVLRVNLENGDVKPVRLPLGEIGKRRSPDGKFLIGLANGQFYCYDVKNDDTKAIPVGKGAFNGYLWLGNDRCAAIASAKTAVLYDRLQHTLTEVASLPSPCTKIGEPSPDGRFAFCVGNRGDGILLDFERKTATSMTGGSGITWVSNNTFAFAREVPDSELRGTWLRTVGEGERRVSPEPYLLSSRGAMMMRSKGGSVIYATKQGLTRMESDGSRLVQIITLQHPPLRAVAVDEWKSN